MREKYITYPLSNYTDKDSTVCDFSKWMEMHHSLKFTFKIQTFLIIMYTFEVHQINEEREEESWLDIHKRLFMNQ